MYIKIYKINDKKIVAVCDKNLVGKRFSDKGIELDVDKDFYKGEEREEKYILKEIKDADIVNIVGEEGIKLALDNGIILKQNIVRIKGVPHAQRI